MAAESTRRRFPAAVLAGVVAVLALIAFAAPGASAQTQTFFVSFTDAAGEPVTDVARDEVFVETDGERSEALGLEPVDWPVRVTVFVDNGLASPPLLDHMREGLRRFVGALPADVEVAIATIGGRPQFQARHTTDRRELEDAVGVIAPEMDGAASFLDALYEEAERLHEDSEGEYFPVIVMVATNGPEGSTRVRERPFREMMERLMANRAAVHTRMYTFTSVTGVKQGGDQMRWAMDIGRVTAGSYEGLSAAVGFRTLLPQLAEDLGRKHRLMSNQYLLTYTPPEDATAESVVRLLTTRAGIRMTPTRDGKVP